MSKAPDRIWIEMEGHWNSVPGYFDGEEIEYVPAAKLDELLAALKGVDANDIRKLALQMGNPDLGRALVSLAGIGVARDA